MCSGLNITVVMPDLEQQILRERQRATRERDLLQAQLEQVSSEIDSRIEATLFLDRVRQYNHNLVRRKIKLMLLD